MSKKELKDRKCTCRFCEEGAPLLMLDEDGIECMISGKEGLPCHAHDDSWWICDYYKKSVNLAKKDIIRLINAYLKGQ